MKKTRYFALSISAVLFTGSIAISNAHAANLFEEEVVTVSRKNQSLLDTSSSVSALSEEDLEMIGATHIQDTLLRIPGVNLHQGNGQEYLPAIRSAVLTGAGACGAFLTAQDHIPLRAAGFCNVNELFEASTELANRIEVIRGPSNALYGSNALHGVVNVLLPESPDQREASMSLETGANDYGRARFYTGNRVGDHGYVINVVGTHDGGFRDDAYYDQQKMQLRHDYYGSEYKVATTFTASNLNQETAGYIEGYKAYEDDNLIKSNPNPEAYRDARSFRLYSRIERELGNQQMITVTPYLRKTEMDFLQHFLPGTPLEQNGQDSLGVMFAWHNDGIDNLNLIAGVDLEVTDGYLKQTQSASSFGSFPQGKQYDYQVDSMQIAPYISSDWRLTERLILNAGLRAENISYDYSNRMISGNTDENGVACGVNGCRYSRPENRSDDFTNYSPKLGLTYKLSATQSLFANIANGYRAPQATELYRLQAQQQIADIDSEELQGVELGYRSIGENHFFETVVFQMQKENVIFQATDRSNVDNGETDHFGVELNYNYRFNEQWSLAMAANYAEHEYANNAPLASTDLKGNKVDSAPKQFGSMQLSWIPVADVQIELEWVHVGEYYTDPQNEHDYDGHDLFNVRADWDVNSNWNLALRLLNLADENYAERADYSTFGGDRYFPGEPRSAYLQFTFKH